MPQSSLADLFFLVGSSVHSFKGDSLSFAFILYNGNVAAVVVIVVRLLLL